MIRRLLALALALLPCGAIGQDSAVLVADSLLVTQDEKLIATGNVQAFYDGATLSAAQVTYDRATDRLAIEGPIFLRDADGIVVTADRADLDARLQDGLLRGARLVLDRQLQLAANRVDRVGDLSALTGAAASSCQVCPGRAPLWEIRAEQVVHDATAEQLYFENARFLVRGVPILWVPRLRLPDPGNERATGLLIPQVRTTDDLGAGLKLPYFIELGPSRDLTLTPYLSPQTRTLEARYRQAFLRGDLQIDGAATSDDLEDGPRGYVSATAAFDLGDRLDLFLSGTLVSDEDYLLDYGYDDADRIESVARLERVGDTTLFLADLTHYRSLRGDEREGSLPPLIGSVEWTKRRDALGGTLTLGADFDGFVRTAGGEGPSGRDVARAGAFAAWRGTRVLAFGIVADGEARAAVDGYRVGDDPAFDDSLLRATPGVALTLRWPWLRRGPGGASDLIEPILSLGWTGAYGGTPPDEDSRLPELDEGNVFALDRLPGEDATEDGPRLSFGVSWTRTGPGFASTFAVGRVLRSNPLEASEASGLSGTASDWLVSQALALDGGFDFGLRTLVQDDLSDPRIGKTEARIGWSNALVTLDAGYLYLPADPVEDRARTASELLFDAEIRPGDRWTLRGDARYDLTEDRPARIGLGFGWRNECVEVDVSVARRYTSADDDGPSTDFGLSVNLNGFSAGRQARVPPGRCRG